MLARAELNYPIEELEIKSRVNRKKAKKKKNYNALVKSVFIFTAIIFLITSLFILVGYAKLSNSRRELTKLERYKVELEKTKLNLLGDLESVKTSLKVSEDATNKLGMIYPTEGQIVYVSVEPLADEIDGNFSLTAQLQKVLNIFSFSF